MRGVNSEMSQTKISRRIFLDTWSPAINNATTWWMENGIEYLSIKCGYLEPLYVDVPKSLPNSVMYFCTEGVLEFVEVPKEI